MLSSLRLKKVRKRKIFDRTEKLSEISLLWLLRQRLRLLLLWLPFFFAVFRVSVTTVLANSPIWPRILCTEPANKMFVRRLRLFRFTAIDTTKITLSGWLAFCSFHFKNDASHDLNWLSNVFSCSTKSSRFSCEIVHQRINLSEKT